MRPHPASVAIVAVLAVLSWIAYEALEPEPAPPPTVFEEIP